ncbi:thermonuclease family protein [Ensifer adhaerens]|uniref:thermonuclease family protein n=1 Tax=Ensifer canadensis TaxID=555315 RepID=UPI0014900CAC|nr:thermonuclease family protein [Ensifer canadensis]
MKFRILCIAAALSAVPVESSAAPAVHVVDGDTLDVNGVRYRLHGVDAPEAGQRCAGANGDEWPCGQEAIRQMEELVLGKTVSCDGRGTDNYGRTISVCVAGQIEINAAMIDAGLAWAFRKYSSDYVAREDAARARATGIWQAATTTPWDYRAQRWEAAVGDAPDRGCPIKGNINRNNVRIYHVPWSKDYAKTKVDQARGEKWFCSEDEALAAGWRAPAWGQ